MTFNYDAWKLSGPDDDGPECGCGERDVRILDGQPICHECYLEEVDGWRGLPTPGDHARDIADERGDWLLQQRRDSER